MLLSIEEITTRYKQEEQNYSAPLTAKDIPFCYEDITPTWLTAVLCTGNPDAKVTAFQLDDADNGTSNRRRLFIQYNQAGQAANLPERVFCKGSQSLESRITLSACGAAQTEVNFYNNISPIMPIDTPTAYFANYNESLNSIIMLKDFETGTITCTDTTDITFERAQDQMHLLATFHGKFFNSPALKTTLASISAWPDFFNALAQTWEPACDQGLDVAGNAIPASLLARRKEIWPATIKSVERHKALPTTLCHGDAHMRNWLINPQGKMGMYDWQGTHLGHFSRDVIYTIATSLTVENRRNWQTELLGYYHEQLQQAAGRSIPASEVFDEIRLQLLSVLAFWTVTLNPAPGMVDAQPVGPTIEFIRRIATAIDDLDALDA